MSTIDIGIADPSQTVYTGTTANTAKVARPTDVSPPDDAGFYVGSVKIEVLPTGDSD